MTVIDAKANWNYSDKTCDHLVFLPMNDIISNETQDGKVIEGDYLHRGYKYLNY